MSKKFVFSAGTGRCGTTSIREVLNSQEDSQISKEFMPLPFISYLKQIEEYINKISERKAKYVGDSAFYITPHIPNIVKLLGNNVKIIYPYRVCSEQVPSNYKHWKDRNNATSEAYARQYNINLGIKNKFFDCHKKYNLPKEEALWWRCEELHEMAHTWEKYYPEHFRIVYFKDFLNDLWVQEYWLKWLGFKKPKPVNVRKNAG